MKDKVKARIFLADRWSLQELEAIHFYSFPCIFCQHLRAELFRCVFCSYSLLLWHFYILFDGLNFRFDLFVLLLSDGCSVARTGGGQPMMDCEAAS